MKVWISRYDYTQTAAKIKALGCDYVLAPLLQLKHYPCDITSEYDAIIITSSNAISAVSHNAEVIAVGEKSAKALRFRGISVSLVFPRVDDLIIALKALPKRNMLYLRGKHITVNLKEELGCAEHVAYSMQARNLKPDEAKSINDVNCVMVYSSRSGRLLGEAMLKHNLDPSFISAICISDKAAESVRSMPFKGVLVARQPNERSMMEQLKELINHG